MYQKIVSDEKLRVFVCPYVYILRRTEQHKLLHLKYDCEVTILVVTPPKSRIWMTSSVRQKNSIPTIDSQCIITTI